MSREAYMGIDIASGQSRTVMHVQTTDGKGNRMLRCPHCYGDIDWDRDPGTIGTEDNKAWCQDCDWNGGGMKVLKEAALLLIPSNGELHITSGNRIDKDIRCAKCCGQVIQIRGGQNNRGLVGYDCMDCGVFVSPIFGPVTGYNIRFIPEGCLCVSDGEQL